MKYTVIIHCVYDGPVEERYESCIIRPANLEDEINDGVNYVKGAGRETFDFYVVNGLEEAILSTYFNPEAIKFENLSKDEIAKKDEIIAKYGWDPVKGVYKKVFLQENNNFISIRKSEYEDLKCTIRRLQQYDEQRDIALHSRLISNSKRELAQEFYNLSEEVGGFTYYMESRKLAEKYGAKSLEVEIKE